MSFLDAAAVYAALDWVDAVDALEQALLRGLDPAAAVGRTIVDLSHGQLLLMPAETADAVGVKVASVTPSNPNRGLPRIQGIYVVLDRETLQVRALMDGTALTTLRTAAVSGVAVSHLAAPDARHLVVFGSGPQARGHVEVIRSMRPLELVTVVSRNAGHAERFAACVSGEGLSASVGSPSAVADADVVVCATTSGAPLFDGRMLGQEACVVAVGSHEPDRREIDAEVVRRAAAGGGVVVEARSVALREAGDVMLALREGACVKDDLLEIDEVVQRRSRVSGVSLFKSCGMGWQDLVVAEAVLARWNVGRG